MNNKFNNIIIENGDINMQKVLEEDVKNIAKIKIQIALNKKMYEIGKITYDIYSKVNEILVSRLTKETDKYPGVFSP